MQFKKAAIDACNAGDMEERFCEELELLQEKLRTWVRVYHDNIDCAYLTVRGASLLFIVVQTTIHHNGGLEDTLNTFAMWLEKDPRLQLVTLKVMTLPIISKTSIQGFLESGAVTIS